MTGDLADIHSTTVDQLVLSTGPAIAIDLRDDRGVLQDTALLTPDAAQALLRQLADQLGYVVNRS